MTRLILKHLFILFISNVSEITTLTSRAAAAGKVRLQSALPWGPPSISETRNKKVRKQRIII